MSNSIKELISIYKNIMNSDIGIDSISECCNLILLIMRLHHMEEPA